VSHSLVGQFQSGCLVHYHSRYLWLQDSKVEVCSLDCSRRMLGELNDHGVLAVRSGDEHVITISLGGQRANVHAKFLEIFIVVRIGISSYVLVILWSFSASTTDVRKI